MKILMTALVLLTVSFNAFSQGKNMKMQHTLKEEIVLSDAGKTVKVLASPSFKVIGLGFKKGQVLEKHTTSTPAVLMVQSGAVDFKMGGKTHELKAGDYFEIPANEEHEVVGKEESFLYLVK